MKNFKEEEIKKFYNFLGHKGISEIRPIRPRWHERKDSKPPSFFINNVEELIGKLKNLDEEYNIYLGLNERKTKGKSDKDVEYIVNIGHDIDAHGDNEDGKNIAYETAIKIVEDTKKLGFKEPLLLDSGRGYWVIHHIKPLKNTEENVQKMKKFGKNIANKYQTEGIEMDTSVYNPSRITRVPGTMNISEKDNPIMAKCLNNPSREEDEKLTDKIIKIKLPEKQNSVTLNQTKISSSIDAFMNYCLNHKIPKGERHNIISKNVAIYLSDHPDREILKEQYIKIQDGSKDELDNWLKQIDKYGKGKYSYGIGELINFTKKYGIPFNWKETPEYKQWLKEKKAEKKLNRAVEKEENANRLRKAITFFTDKKNLAEQFLKIQPLFYDSSKIWWIWNFKELKWDMCDEIDVINEVSKNSEADTISSREKNEILEALRQVSRGKKPKDISPMWIQFKEKIVDLETDEEFEASPDFFVTNPIPYNLGDSNETPIMDKIFVEWVGRENVQLLYEIISYCMLPSYPLNRIFCFVGSGMNGKSKFLELLRNFIGNNNTTSTELDTLLNSRFEVTRLFKKLVCQMGETNFNEMGKTSMLKKLSGGDYINYEHKNKKPFEDLNYAKILISTNTLPSTKDKTIGFYRRWVIVDFPNQFSEKKDILAEIPDYEMNNLALKSLKYLKNLLKKREFHNEGTIEERTKKYEDRSNPLQKFVKEFFDNSDPEAYITKSQFSKKLNDWLKSNGYRSLSDIEISKRMKTMGYEDGRDYIDWYENGQLSKKLARVWIGIKLKGGKND